MPSERPLPRGPVSLSNWLQRSDNIVDAINNLQAVVYGRMKESGGQIDGGRAGTLDIFVGLTTETPPYPNTAYTDARYYVTRAIAPDPNSGDPANGPNYGIDGALKDPLTAAADPFNGHLAIPSVITATNLAELPPDYAAGGSGAGTGTHLLKDSSIVLVVGFPSLVNPTQRTYVFIAPIGDVGIYRVTGYDAANGFYLGRTQVRNTTPIDPTVDLNLSDYYSDKTGSNDVGILNVAENKGSGQFLRKDGTQYVVAWPAGTSGGIETPIPLVKCDVEPPKQLYRITGFDSATGYYLMKAQISNGTQPDSTVDLNFTDYFTDGDSVSGLNIAEQHQYTILPTDGTYYVRGWQDGFTSDGSPVPLVYFDVHLGLFPVLCTVESGAAGSMNGSTTCDFTYSITTLDGDAVPNGTGLTPKVYRVPNCTYNTPSAGSPGIAYIGTNGQPSLYDVAQERIPGAVVNNVTSLGYDSGAFQWQYKATQQLVMDKKDEDTGWTPFATGERCS
jgi:hypothetical protein